MATEKLSIKVERNPPESRLAELAPASCKGFYRETVLRCQFLALPYLVIRAPKNLCSIIIRSRNLRAWYPNGESCHGSSKADELGISSGHVVVAHGNGGGAGLELGPQAMHLLPPKTVVQVLKENEIKKVMLFDADQSTMSALASSCIEVMVAIPNNMLDSIIDYGAAKDSVKHNVTRYNFDSGVTIKYGGAFFPVDFSST